MKVNIILIDDDEMDLFISQKNIEKSGIDFNIKTFVTGNSAIDYLKTLDQQNSCQTPFIPNLILLDINMPEMNGFQFLKEFDKLHNIKGNSMKIYMLSSIYSQDIDSLNNEEYCDGFITKPLTAQHLNKIVSSFKPYLSQYDYLNEDFSIEILKKTP